MVFLTENLLGFMIAWSQVRILPGPLFPLFYIKSCTELELNLYSPKYEPLSQEGNNSLPYSNKKKFGIYA
jgi:hypothetical protein